MEYTDDNMVKKLELPTVGEESAVTNEKIKIWYLYRKGGEYELCCSNDNIK